MRDDAQALELLKAYHAEIEQHSSPWKLEPGELATGRAILSADDQLRIAVICALLCHPPQPGYVFRASRDLLRHLCRRSLPYTLDDIHVIVQALRLAKHPYHLPAQALLRALIRPLADPDMLAACQSDLEQLRAAADAWYSSADQRKFLKLLDELLGGKPERPVPIHPDSWGTHVLTLLDEMECGLRDNWLALVRHCSAATGSTPGGTWLARMHPLVETLGREAFVHLATAWLSTLRRGQGTRLDEGNADLLKRKYQ
jgi:hypothetical protein